MTERQFSILVAAIYFVITFFFVVAPPVAVAVGTGAAYILALNLVALSEKTADMTHIERMLYIKFGIG